MRGSKKYLASMDRFRLITDHKPLVPRIKNKAVDTVPVRCHRLLMRLQCQSRICAREGPRDALSHSPVENGDNTTEKVNECHINTVTHSWLVS